jgi:hypothetical protein
MVVRPIEASVTTHGSCGPTDYYSRWERLIYHTFSLVMFKFTIETINLYEPIL